MSPSGSEPPASPTGETTPASTRRGVLRSLLRGLRSFAIGYLMVLLLLRLFENRLVYPAPKAERRWRDMQSIPKRDVWFTSEDGVKLHGWYAAAEQPRAYLLYAHGNGENVSDQAELLNLLRDRYQVSVLTFDYRGYGKSEGSPHESGVLADGEAAFAWLRRQARNEGASQPKFVLMGRSLGGGVMVDLASRHAIDLLVLESTFSSMVDAAAMLYWWAPVRLLMQNRYESLDKIKRYRGPLVQTHYEGDGLIPIELGRQLFDACPSQDKLFLATPGGGHNVPAPVEYYQHLDRTFDRLFGSAEIPAKTTKSHE